MKNYRMMSKLDHPFSYVWYETILLSSTRGKRWNKLEAKKRKCNIDAAIFEEKYYMDEGRDGSRIFE
jgi:hypothetical protein